MSKAEDDARAAETARRKVETAAANKAARDKMLAELDRQEAERRRTSGE